MRALRNDATACRSTQEKTAEAEQISTLSYSAPAERIDLLAVDQAS
jgi:hypothetical protein